MSLRRQGLILTAAALGFCQSFVVADDQNCEKTKSITEIGIRSADTRPFPDITDTDSIPLADARYIRLRLEVDDAETCDDWLLFVRDQENRLFQVFSKADFRSSPSQWTVRVPGNRINLEYRRCAGARSPRVSVAEYLGMPREAKNTYYSRQNDANPTEKPLFSPDVDSKTRTFGESVGFLMFSWLRDNWICSGVMISPDVILTNWHCGAPPNLPPSGFWNKDIVRDLIVDLSWDGDAFSREFHAVELVDINEKLDVALLRVEPLGVGLGTVQPVRFGVMPQSGDILVIHHAAGREKLLSKCSVVGAAIPGWKDKSDKTEFTHTCDTERGSSGAPVLDYDGRLVGLHHLGFAYNSETCKSVDRVNKGIRMENIVNWIRDNPKTRPLAVQLKLR
jgi:Trypsin-like peptidase domain